MIHFYKTVFSLLPRGKEREIAQMLKALHAKKMQLPPKKDAANLTKLSDMKLGKAADFIERKS